MIREPRIVTCDQWDARPPRSPIVRVDRPDKIIVHHTAGHAPGTSLDDAKVYARAIQADHMSRTPPYIDSGHNFLVMRAGGVILEGRHGSVRAIDAGQMVSSAHCPGQNTNPGIEHESVAGDTPTPAQAKASAALCAWICDRTGIPPTALHPHSEFFATACPGELKPWIPKLSRDVAALLAPKPPAASDHKAELLWRLWALGEGKYKDHGPFEGKRPDVIDPVPREWFVRLIRFLKNREKLPTT